MFQVEVKRRLVEYLFPQSRGWHVVVHLDPMEICRGGEHSAAKVEVARDCLSWFAENGVRLGVDEEYGKADLVARNASSGEVFVIEVEGSSSRQPDQALYSALGQTLLRKYSDLPPARFGLAVPAVPRWERQLSRVPRRLVQELDLHVFLVYSDRVRDLSRWPTKVEREAWEINEFLGVYRKLPHGVDLEVIEKSDKPDFFAREVQGERVFGIELTAVYLSDRSVPDIHMNEEYDWVNPVCSDADLLTYEKRLIDAVRTKVAAAGARYDRRHQLLLSVYVNEYISQYMAEEHWRRFREKYQDVFNDIRPFSEIIFWNLLNGGAFCVLLKAGTYKKTYAADSTQR